MKNRKKIKQVKVKIRTGKGAFYSTLTFASLITSTCFSLLVIELVLG